MKHYDLILNPAHYVLDRKIQPINVIENWRLCHHLACVVKYCARLGRKDNTFQDLQKSEWYLERELTRYKHGFNKCHLQLVELNKFTPTDVAMDWTLSPGLHQMLIQLKLAQKNNYKANYTPYR
jgi:uncharacterized protein DUF3310